MEHLSDKELALRAQGGSPLAFETLANRHYEMVLRTAYKWQGTKEDAEDITQDVFIKAARGIKNFRGDANIKTWLYTITVNTVKDYRKKYAIKKGREAIYLDEMDYAAEEVKDNNPLSAEDLFTIIKNELPPKYGDALLLVHSEGLSHKEASVILKCAETTVSWRIYKAKEKLKKLIAKQNN